MCWMWKNMDKLKEHIDGLTGEEEYLAVKEIKKYYIEAIVKDIFDTSFNWGKFLSKDANNLENSNVYKLWVRALQELIG